MKYRPILFIIILFAVCIFGQNSNNRYKEYCFSNNYGNFCIAYPENILIPQREADAHDGIVFLSKNKKNSITFFHSMYYLMEPEWNIDFFYKNNLKEYTKTSIRYKKIGKDFYVISGKEKGKIFYRKSMVIAKNLLTVLFEYQEKDKKLFDGLISKLPNTIRIYDLDMQVK